VPGPGPEAAVSPERVDVPPGPVGERPGRTAEDPLGIGADAPLGGGGVAEDGQRGLDHGLGHEPQHLRAGLVAGLLDEPDGFTECVGDRFGPLVLLYPAFVAMPVALAILSFASTHAQLVASAILFGLGLGSAFPAFMTLIVGATDERSRARTFGSVIWAFDTGIGIGSLAIGAIGQRYGLGTGFALSAGLSALAIPVFLMTARRFVVTAR